MKNLSIRKILIIALVFCTIICLVGCVTDRNDGDKTIVDEALSELNLGDLTSVKTNLTLPVSGKNNVSFTWFSSNETYVKNDGTVMRPEHGIGDKIITLTCTAKLNKETQFKEFIITVCEQEKVFEALGFDMLVAFTDASVSGGIKFTAVTKESNLKVYYAMNLKDSKKLNAEDIMGGTDSSIVSKGTQVGGYIAYSIMDLDAEQEFDIYLVIKDDINNIISDVNKVTVKSSNALFFGGEDVIQLGYLPIYNLKDLEEFARGYNVGDYLFNQNVKLMADIDMSKEYGEGKKNWVPLNYNNDKPNGQDQANWEYQGTFDGNGHTINGLYCHSDLEYVGFFKKFDTKANIGKVPAANPSGRIINLTFTNVDIKAIYNKDCGRQDVDDSGKVTNVYSARAVGTVAGFFRGGLIENVNVIGGTVCSEGVSTSNAGGLVGMVQSNGWVDGRGDVTVTIRNCMTDVTVNASGIYAGGLIGSMDEGMNEETRQMLITDCYTLGDTKGSSIVGGIVGCLRGQLVNAVAYGKVEAGNEGTASGVVGSLSSLNKKSSFMETKLESVAYMGDSIKGKNIYNIASIGSLIKNGSLDVSIKNLYSNSSLITEFLIGDGLPTINNISLNDFVAKIGVNGFDAWKEKTNKETKILVFTNGD